MVVHTAEKDQVRHFAQIYLGQITFFYVQTAAWLYCCGHKLRLLKFLESCKRFFITPWTTTTSDWLHHLNITKRKPYKILNILNPEGYSLQLLMKTTNENNKYFKFSFELNVIQKVMGDTSVVENTNERIFKTRAKNESCQKYLWQRKLRWNEVCQWKLDYFKSTLM